MIRLQNKTNMHLDSYIPAVEYLNKGNILRKEHGTDKVTVLSKEELKRLGVDKPEHYPDVHIPINEVRALFKLIESKK